MTRVVELAREKKVLVCVGPGGVGKTTTAAALGALAARQGRRTLVCTIDPAPRPSDGPGVSASSIPTRAPRAARGPVDLSASSDTTNRYSRRAPRHGARLRDARSKRAGARLRRCARRISRDHDLSARSRPRLTGPSSTRPRSRSPRRSTHGEPYDRHRARHAAHGERARLSSTPPSAVGGGRVEPGVLQWLMRPPPPRRWRPPRGSRRSAPRAGGAPVLVAAPRQAHGAARRLDDIGAFLV